MARSDAERLEFYQALRDRCEDALIDGVPVMTYSTMDGRSTQREQTAEWLGFLDKQVAKLRRAKSGFAAARRTANLRSR